MKVNIKELVLDTTVWFGTVGHCDFSRNKMPRAGMYLFYDGSYQKWPKFGHEKGIFIDQQRYIPLETLNPSLMNKAQVLEYREKKGIKIPFLCDLMSLLQYENEADNTVRLVNNALSGYSRQDCHLPTDILNQCWYQEALDEACDMDLRHLVLIESLVEGKSSQSMVFRDEDQKWIDSFVTPDGQIWYPQGDRFSAGDFCLMAQAGEQKLLVAGTQRLFLLEDNVLKFIGYSPKKIGNDVIICDGGVFQVCEDGMRRLQGGASYAEFDEKDQLVVTSCNDFYGGGEQYIRERYVDYYKRDEKELWQNVGHVYHP